MSSLKDTVTKLESNPDVDGLFITGSYGLKISNSDSDLDLIIILKENKNNLRSLYEWIDDVFADIFFFYFSDLKRVVNDKNIDWNSMDGMLVSWIQKADIKFDHSGALTSLKEKTSNIEQVGVTESEKRIYWQKLNYNYVANKRYFKSENVLYHEALELRLLYSTLDLICTFLALRDIPWRGEKSAILYLKENAPQFYEVFQKYTKSPSLNERFKYYEEMVLMTFTEKYQQWTEEDKIVMKKDSSVAGEDDEIISYINSLL